MRDPALHTTTEMRDDATAVDRDVTIRLRVTAVEANAWKSAADKAGLTLSEFIRRRVTGEQTIRIEAPPAPAGVTLTGKDRTSRLLDRRKRGPQGGGRGGRGG